MAHYNIQQNIIDYILDLYSKLEGKVVTSEWESEVFKFRKGVFQGDPYSPIIFLVSFNPIIQYLKSLEDRFGYELIVKDENNEITTTKRIITTPFADDFNLLTGHKTRHQTLEDDIQKKATSMGLTFKPKKCRTLSICGGKPSQVDFTLQEISEQNETRRVVLKSLNNDPHKFLGQWTASNF